MWILVMVIWNSPWKRSKIIKYFSLTFQQQELEMNLQTSLFGEKTFSVCMYLKAVWQKNSYPLFFHFLGKCVEKFLNKLFLKHNHKNLTLAKKDVLITLEYLRKRPFKLRNSLGHFSISSKKCLTKRNFQVL